MHPNRSKVVEKIVPFIFIGIAIAFSIALFIFFSYVFVWGLLIGLVLWLFFTIKNLIMPKNPAKKKSSRGRIIEHDKNK